MVLDNFLRPLRYSKSPQLPNKESRRPLDFLRPKSSASSSSFQKCSLQYWNPLVRCTITVLVLQSRQRPPIFVSELGRPRLAPKPVVIFVAVAVEFTKLQLFLSCRYVGRRDASQPYTLLHRKPAAATRDCPTDRRGVEHNRKETRETGSHTARSCLVKECYRSQKTSKNHNRPQNNVARRSPEYSQHEKYPDLITASHLAQRSSPNGSLVHVLR